MMVSVLRVSRLAGKLLRQMEAIKKWNRSDDPDRAIEQAPRQRDVPDMSANERERNDGAAGNQSAPEDPGVADWVSKRPDEKQRDDEMAERKPVGPVTDKGKSSVGFL
jgi:hypothetical protein